MHLAPQTGRPMARAACAFAFAILLATCQTDKLTEPPGPQPALAVVPAWLLDSAAAGSMVPAATTIIVTNAAQGTLSWSARLARDAPWLAVTPLHGNAPTALAISLLPTDLTPGVYRDTVIVLAEGATGSPVDRKSTRLNSSHV